MPKPPSTTAARYEEPDFEALIAREPSPMQEHFGEWVAEKTGLTFATKKEEAAFHNGVRVGTILRGYHQASPENQTRLAEAKAAREKAAAAAAAAAEAAPEKAAAPAKATKATKAAAPPAEQPKAAAKRAPAKKTGGRRPTVVAQVEDDEAPF